MLDLKSPQFWVLDTVEINKNVSGPNLFILFFTL